MPTTSANMSLQTPLSGETDYPTSVANSFSQIDEHDHTSGNGVQIPSGGIVDGAITTAKLASGVLTADATGRAKMADGFVSTAKLGDAAVTQAKRAALGQQISTASSAVAYTGSTYADVTNLSVSITTTGRPVFVGLIPGSSADSGIEVDSGSVSGSIAILRDASIVSASSISAVSANLTVPVSSVFMIDIPAAGTYTYKVQSKVIAAGGILVRNAKLIAYEL